jgi:HEXXH motif-containing protein
VNRTHRLTEAAIDQLAAGTGDPSVVAALRAGQLSRRLLQLRYLRQVTSQGRVDDSWELARQLSRAAPDAFRWAVLLPHTGAWLASTLRHIRSAGSDQPDLAYLGMLAAAAADRARIEFKLDVVPRNGTVFLPDMGRAVVGDTPQVTVSRSGGELRVGAIVVPGPSEPEPDGWQRLRRLRAEAGGLAITLRLDDLDPFRDCHDLSAADRLTPAEAAGWQRLLDEAWPILVTHHREYAEAITAGLMTVVPLRAERSSVGINVTSMDAFGAVAMSTPVDGHGLALGLLHEFQHAKLGALLDIVPLYQRDDRPRFYAPWRDDPRPLGAALQGVYAFLGVTDFWRVQRRVLTAGRARLAEAEFARWRDRVWRTFRELEASDRFTPTGRRFLAGLRSRQEQWRAEPASGDALALARQAAEDHWIGWRLRNRRPDPAVVARLAEAWRAGEPCPELTVPATIQPGRGRQLAYSPRLDLTRIRITDAERFARLQTGREALAPEASTADLALAAGDHEAAREAYRVQIMAGDGGLDPWIGLTLACHRQAGEQPPLLAEPELCRAVHQRLRTDAGEPVDPLALAGWLQTMIH